MAFLAEGGRTSAKAASGGVRLVVAGLLEKGGAGEPREAGDKKVGAQGAQMSLLTSFPSADTNVLRYIQLTQLKMNRCSLPREDSGTRAGPRDVIG